MPRDFALARLEPRPLCWNLYDTPEAAAADLERANASAARMGEPPWQPMTYDTFAQAKRDHYLGAGRNPLNEITAEAYDEALNVLPPLRWERRDGVERFLMREMLDGSVTEQYAQLNGRFWSRRADARDPETWITAAEIVRHIEQETTHG